MPLQSEEVALPPSKFEDSVTEVPVEPESPTLCRGKKLLEQARALLTEGAELLLLYEAQSKLDCVAFW